VDTVMVGFAVVPISRSSASAAHPSMSDIGVLVRGDTRSILVLEGLARALSTLGRLVVSESVAEVSGAWSDTIRSIGVPTRDNLGPANSLPLKTRARGPSTLTWGWLTAH
jgi:hypothetical protein